MGSASLSMISSKLESAKSTPSSGNPNKYPSPHSGARWLRNCYGEWAQAGPVDLQENWLQAGQDRQRTGGH